MAVVHTYFYMPADIWLR